MNAGDSKTRRVVLARHGRTTGNQERRYVGGRTDEGLGAVGRAELEASAPAFAALQSNIRLYASPMRRCLESAAILFPGMTPTVVEEFREIDFGDFEGKSWRELADDPRYQAWLESGGTTTFPGGESRDAFIQRCYNAFCRIILEDADSSVPVVCLIHGGTIMAILSVLTGGDYFDFQVAPGQGYEIIVRTVPNGLDLVSYARVGDRIRP